jgi:hypothetical protein
MEANARARDTEVRCAGTSQEKQEIQAVLTRSSGQRTAVPSVETESESRCDLKVESGD